MRELVLNHASLKPAGWHEIVELLPDLADCIAELVKAGIVRSAVRMFQLPYEIIVQGDRSLLDAYRECRRRGWREQSLFLQELSSKVPLHADLSPNVVDRLLVCETRHLASEDGGPLLVCVMTDSIALSFPTKPCWDRDRLLVKFKELLPDDTWNYASEEVDNLARSAHADSIIKRNRQRVKRQCSDTSTLWRRRAEMFPHLLFGPDVQNQLSRINVGWLPTLLNRLAELDETASDWRESREPTPSWKCKVTPESTSVMNHPRLSGARIFRSVCGQRRQFKWHARFGSSGRIHLRFNARMQQIEVGYIGKHLPL